MPYLLNLIYIGLLCGLSPYLVWAAVRKGKYRTGYAQKLLGRVTRRRSDRPCIWFHAVSAGEVNLLAPLIRLCQREFPDHECVLSTTTNTGFEIAQKTYPGLTVFYCPLDFSWAVRNAFARLRPTLLVLAELELWPNLIHEADRRGVRIAVVNGRLSESSARGYARIAWFVRSLLRRINVLAVQTEEYAKRFKALGANPDAVYVTGSMKFDGAHTDRTNSRTRELSELWGIETSDVVFLAGSTQAPEEEYAIEAFRALRSDSVALRLILVPRHPERFHAVAQLLDRSGLPWERRSELGSGSNGNARVLLVDTMGELSAWWGTAHIGYVGGSLGSRGGQSMIEPAAYGVATSFGPKTHNFRDVVRLMLAREAAVVVRDGQGLTEFVRTCLQNTTGRKLLGTRARQLVSEQLGATDKTLALLRTMLATKTAPRRAA